MKRLGVKLSVLLMLTASYMWAADVVQTQVSYCSGVFAGEVICQGGCTSGWFSASCT